MVAQGKADYGNVVPAEWVESLTSYENAKCVNASPGNIIRHSDGDAYLINSNWTRSWLSNGGTYRCTQATGSAVVDGVPRYYIDDLTAGSNLSRSCIVKGPGGDAHFINTAGLREWMPDAPTYDCEVGRGVPVYGVSNGFITGTAETGWHYCLNQSQMHNKLLRHSDGDVSYIHPDNTRTWVPDSATYNCRVRQGRPLVQTRWREYVTSFRDNGWDYCYDNVTLRNKIISHPDGDSHFVDERGVRHWIPNQATYNCLRSRGIPAETVSWREYIDRTPEAEWAVCGSTLTTNQRLDRGQWLQSDDGRYKLHMQSGDGNLVLYNSSGSAIWATNVAGGQYTLVQGDGNWVVRNSGGSAIWNRGTAGSGANRLVVQSDGNLVLYAGSRAVWWSNTAGR
jgi:hypothetical protein